MKSQLNMNASFARNAIGACGKFTIALLAANLLLSMPAEARRNWGGNGGGGGGGATNVSPTALITVSSTSGKAPFTTTFDGSKSSDSDGSITTYSWSFGDGGSSSAATVSHAYSTAGTYSASLKVTDNGGATKTASVAITVTAAEAPPPPPPVVSGAPAGIFAVIGIEAGVNSKLLTDPDVAGVIVRNTWSNIEEKQGVYDWSYLDSAIATVTNAGKKVSLVMNSGGVSVPPWVLDLDVDTFTYVKDTQVTIPVFWDPVYLQKKIAFIKAAGVRYGSNPNVVMVNAQCANAYTADWYVPSNGTDITQWQSLGFSSEKVLAACQQVVDATMTAFPNKPVAMALGSISSELDSYQASYVAAGILDYANANYPGRFIASRFNLSVKTLDPATESKLDGGWQLLYDNQPNSGAQMLWWASDITSCKMNGGVTPCNAYTMLDKSVTTGLNYGMSFLELYEADIYNTALRPIIHNAAMSLGAN